MRRQRTHGDRAIEKLENARLARIKECRANKVSSSEGGVETLAEVELCRKNAVANARRVRAEEDNSKSAYVEGREDGGRHGTASRR